MRLPLAAATAAGAASGGMGGSHHGSPALPLARLERLCDGGWQSEDRAFVA